MEGWPSYWENMVPMHYATHVVSPVLGLLDGRAEYVTCMGSGTVSDELAAKSGYSSAVQSCQIKVRSETGESRCRAHALDTNAVAPSVLEYVPCDGTNIDDAHAHLRAYRYLR